MARRHTNSHRCGGGIAGAGAPIEAPSHGSATRDCGPIVLETSVSINLNIPFSKQYASTAREGHQHPPPSRRAHTTSGISASLRTGPEGLRSRQHVGGDSPTAPPTPPRGHGPPFPRFEPAVGNASARRGLPIPATLRRFDPEDVPAPWTRQRSVLWEPFSVASPNSIRFTLWWSNTNAPAPTPHRTPDALARKGPGRRPPRTMSRSASLNHETLDLPPQAVGAPIVGQAARERILTEVDRVRSICEPRPWS